MKRHFSFNQYTIGLSLTFIVIILYFLQIDLINQVELKTLDLRFRSFRKTIPVSNIVIVTIDDASEDILGRWPWTRNVMAQAVENLHAWGAKVIGLDIVFSEKEVNPVSRIPWARELPSVPATTIRRLEQGLDSDAKLASAIGKSGNVVLSYYFLTEERKEIERLSANRRSSLRENINNGLVPVVRSTGHQPGSGMVRSGYGIEAGLPEFCHAGLSSGFLNIFPDSDDVVRKATLAMREENEWYLSFPLQVARAYWEQPAVELEIGPLGITRFLLGDRRIPVNGRGEILVDYTVKNSSFPRYSFVDVLQGRVKAEAIRDKIVLIGITNPGLVQNTVATPVSIEVPGIEIHAQTIDTLLHQRFFACSGWVEIANIAAILLSGLILVLAIPHLPGAVSASFLAVFLLVGYGTTGFYLFREHHIWLNMVFPALSTGLTYTSGMLFRTIAVEKKSRFIRNAFQTYVPPQVVEQLVKNPEKLKLGGERKVVSVLFSDIKGFTTLSETLEPMQLAEFLNSYLTPMTGIIFKHQGTLDKYIGDAIVAFFGAPLEQPDHAGQTVLAALEMMEKLKAMNAVWAAQGKPSIDIGIGINTGEVSVGNMGSSARFDYTVMGDTVNIAQRLEQLTRVYKNNILITEATWKEVRNTIPCNKIAVVELKGRKGPVAVYEPCSRQSEEHR